MLHLHKVATIIILVGAFGVGCATGSGPRITAKDEMKEGYKAAKRGYWQEALMRFEQADRLEPNQVRILNNVAVALEAVGRFEDAKAVYERAMIMDPGDSKLKKNQRLAKEFYNTNIAEKVATPGDEEEAGAEKAKKPSAGQAGEGDDDA